MTGIIFHRTVIKTLKRWKVDHIHIHIQMYNGMEFFINLMEFKNVLWLHLDDIIKRCAVIFLYLKKQILHTRTAVLSLIHDVIIGNLHYI